MSNNELVDLNKRASMAQTFAGRIINSAPADLFAAAMGCLGAAAALGVAGGIGTDVLVGFLTDAIKDCTGAVDEAAEPPVPSGSPTEGES